jgi:hypothetical protein
MRGNSTGGNSSGLPLEINMTLHTLSALPGVVTQVETPRAARTLAPVATPPPLPPVVTRTPAEMAHEQDVINRATGAVSRDMEFTSDPATHRLVMRVLDNTSGQVIRQYPSEGALAIAQYIDQQQRGKMLRQKD